jgi:hypothetical protein
MDLRRCVSFLGGFSHFFSVLSKSEEHGAVWLCVRVILL